MKTASQLKSTFNEQGYVLVPGALGEPSRRAILSAIAKTFHKYRSEIGTNADFWNEESSHQKVMQFRKESPEWFGAVYDTMQTSSSLYRVIHDDAIQDVASELLGQTPEDLCATGHMVRMDPPEDKRNVLAWHQESFYYNQNLIGDHGLVVWIPLRDVAPEHGPIWVCPGSHKAGRLSAKSLGRKDGISSEQFVISPEDLARYKPVQISAKAGDAVFFHMDLLHRSGENTSNRIRFTAGVRFHCMLKDDFLPGKLIYHPNEMIEKQRQAKMEEGVLL